MVHTAASADAYTVASVARALDVLCAFEQPPHEFGPSELARQLGMTKNHAFRVLKTLESHGFVRKVAERYRIGVRAFEVGQLAVKQLDVVKVARPVMHQLHAQTGETIHLAILDGLEAVCVDRVESTHAIRLSAEVGKRFPLHAGACPKVLLAFLTPDEQQLVLERPLHAFTHRTQTDPAKLRAELAEISREGYGIGDEDLDLGAAAVAAPIRDITGQVVAAVSVAGPLMRIRTQLRTTLRDRVLDAAQHIAADLGYSRREGSPHGTSTVA
ncbi:MAG TPA: IclR family transcriptional regulator [Chloroflexota bacterium]|jgi:DNA-binding IclR family transcriptional regulator